VPVSVPAKPFIRDSGGGIMGFGSGGGAAGLGSSASATAVGKGSSSPSLVPRAGDSKSRRPLSDQASSSYLDEDDFDALLGEEADSTARSQSGSRIINEGAPSSQ